MTQTEKLKEIISQLESTAKELTEAACAVNGVLYLLENGHSETTIGLAQMLGNFQRIHKNHGRTLPEESKKLLEELIDEAIYKLMQIIPIDPRILPHAPEKKYGDLPHPKILTTEEDTSTPDRLANSHSKAKDKKYARPTDMTEEDIFYFGRFGRIHKY